MNFNPVTMIFNHIISLICLVISSLYLLVTNVINKLLHNKKRVFSQSQNENRIMMCELAGEETCMNDVPEDVIREASVKETSMNDLPEDVFIEVLLRLPVKSLLRFKVVCKAWRSPISNPKFVKRHNVITTINPQNDYFISHNKSPSSDHDHLCAININFLDRAISLNPPSHDDNFNVVGSCNGLLCLDYKRRKVRRNKHKQSMTKKLYLWNPATRKKKELPRYKINITEDDYDDYHVSLGFGFDFASSDYKVVRIVRKIVRKKNKDSSENRVEVYSMINNSWKEIEINSTFKVSEFYCPAFVKGSLYWRMSGHALVLFNVQSEIFCTISLPPNTWCHDVFEFKEAVAFTHKVYDSRNINPLALGDDSNEFIDIWALDDDRCWIKELTIKRLLRKETVVHILNKGLKLVGCLKTGEFVGRILSDELVLHDSVTGNIKNNIPLKMHTRRTYNYSESLVNLN